MGRNEGIGILCVVAAVVFVFYMAGREQARPEMQAPVAPRLAPPRRIPAKSTAPMKPPAMTQAQAQEAYYGRKASAPGVQTVEAGQVQPPKLPNPFITSQDAQDPKLLRMAEAAVKGRLLAPSGATFFPMTWQPVNGELGMVVGQLDTSNRYDARVRMSFRCLIEKTRGAGNLTTGWRVVQVELRGDQSAKSGA